MEQTFHKSCICPQKMEMNQGVPPSFPVLKETPPKTVIANRKSNFFWISEQNKLGITLS